jgi:capsular polysaccharide biosynthesis protein
MKKRNLPQNEKNERVRRERDPIPWRYCFLTLLCGGILVIGFFFAARQHFSAISLGMKNSELRKQRDDLQTEQRRLKVSREVAFSPSELEKVARGIGLEKVSNVAYQIAGVEKKVEEKVKNAFAKPTKDTKSEKSANNDKSAKTAKSLSEIIKNDDLKDAKKEEKPSKSDSTKQDAKLDKKGK